MKIFVAAGLALLLTACASGYDTFYKQVADPVRVSSSRIAPPPAMPLVQRSPPGDPTTIESSFARKGYFVIGYSSFNGGTGQSESGAIEKAKEVGADLVLILNPQYAGTRTSVVPIVTPTTSTSYTTGSATAYGSGGTVHAYGSGTTKTYGSQTNYIPISVDRMDYTAVYFVKQKLRMGLFTRDLDDDERKTNGTNKGVVVRLVVDGSPAYMADLLPDDVITEIDGKPVFGVSGFTEITQSLPRGEISVPFKMLRQGVEITKIIALE